MSRRTVMFDPLQRSLFDEASMAADDVAAAAPPAALAHSAPTASMPAPLPDEPPQSLPFLHPRAQRCTVLNGQRVDYEMRRALRRSIGFIVGAEGLTVSAPRWVGNHEIESALQEKGGWILRKLHEQRERERRLQSARVDWRDGTGLPFLGETVILLLDPRGHGVTLDAAGDGLPGVAQRLLRVALPHDASPAQIRDAVQGWLQRQARRIFEERCAEFAQRLGVRVRRIALSSAATRWGSANASGAIRLNWRLIHFSLPIIDYVVAHELAHLREMNHSPAFWDVGRSVLPDYQRSRGALREQTLPILD
jgi:predicted metal-dependent hydrolase